MGSCDEFETVDMVELRSNFVAEQPASTTGADSPRLDFFGVAPDKVAKGTLVGDLLSSRDDPNLVDGPDLRAQAAVHT